MAKRVSKGKVLVTGGAGFIGSHIVDAYLDAGYTVTVVDNLTTGRAENVNPGAVFYEVDLRDLRLAEIFERERPDYISHHAAQASVRLSVEDPLADADINIIGSLRLLELARQYGIKKVIFASTGGAIYGEQDYFPADESHPVRPVSPYGCAKAAVEAYLNYYRQVYGLAYTVLRYANVYGPRQDPLGEAGVVAIFSQQMLSGVQPVINGSGKQTRDFVYVADVARANLQATTGDSGVFNVGTGIETSVRDLFDQLSAMALANAKPSFGPPKSGEQWRSVLDGSRAAEVLDWRPEIGLDEGLRLTVDFFSRAPAGIKEELV